MMMVNGGPASPETDGWVTYVLPVVSGLMYRDSVELDEIKHPILFKNVELKTGTGGAGRRRGGLACEVTFGPREDMMTIVIPSDCQINPARGVRGGQDGALAAQFRVSANGDETKLPNVCNLEIGPGEWIRGTDAGGGGYGEPREREPERVMQDVARGWETFERAREIYGVVLTGDVSEETLAIDWEATSQARA